MTRALAWRIARLFVTTMLAWTAVAHATGLDAFDTGRARFTAAFGETVNPYRELATFVMPGEVVPIEVLNGTDGLRLAALAEGGRLDAVEAHSWVWKAPITPGLYRLRLKGLNTNDVMQFNVFVMHPRSRAADGTLNGYPIGHYPETPLRNMDNYRPPQGFVEITPELLDVRVSPHFRIGQFLCKQEAGSTKYLVLQSSLPLKLETVLEEVNTNGVRTDSFSVMSGYRTPAYNRRVGNETTYSRHLWGDAADVFIDRDGDGRMDDLNRDGRIDQKDADWLASLVEGLEETHTHLVGGLGRYKATAYHGPFIHIDTRGFKVRW
jgi:hypothetical protein